MTRCLVAGTRFGALSSPSAGFRSIGETNDAPCSGWTRAVDSGDEGVFVGDLAVPSEPVTV